MPRLVHIGREDPIDPEARHVLHHDRGLAHAAAEHDGGADAVRIGARARDDFEQRHARDRREEVHADHPLRPLRRRRDLVDRDRRRVGGEHRLAGRHRLHFTQHLLLDLEVLEHRFDHELGATEPGIGVAPRNQGDEAGVFVLGDAASLEPVVEDLARGEESLRDARQVGVLQPDVHARLGHRRACDPGPHEARPHDAKPLHLRRRRGLRGARGLLQLRGGEEDLDQLAGNVRDREAAEQLRLALQPLGEAMPQAVLDGFERRDGPGVVAPRLLEHLLARHAEHQHPAERVAVEQPADNAAGPSTPGPPAAGQALRRREGDVVKDRGRHQLVHDAELVRPLGTLDFACEDHVERGTGADQSGQPLAAAGTRQDAELHFGQPELGLGVISRNPVGAGQRELQPTPQAGTVNSHDDRLRERRDAAQHVLAIGRQPLRFGGRGELDELLNIRARDEVVGLTGKKRDCLNAGLGR